MNARQRLADRNGGGPADGVPGATPTRGPDEPDRDTTGRVVFVSQAYPPEQGGNASRIHDTATNLAREGWDVTVLAPPACYPFGRFDRSWKRAERYEADGVDVVRLWTYQPSRRDPGSLVRLPYFLLFAAHALLWLLWHRRRYDALVTSTPPVFTGLPGLVVSLLGVPWAVDVRDLWIENAVALGYVAPGSVAERAARAVERATARRADLLTVTTPSLGEAVARDYGADLAEKTSVVPNGVDTTLFYPEPREGHVEEEDRDPDPDGRPTIVYTGNLGRAQDLETVVAAMADVDATLRLVGSGDAEDDLRALAADLGVEDRVEFAGLRPREAMRGELDAAQVGVAPIRATDELAYAMPTKVYEYLACGLPAVVLGRGELERFAAESGGCIHAESDPAAVAGALNALLADPERREAMGRAGYEHVTAHYDRRGIARRLSGSLAGLLAE